VAKIFEFVAFHAHFATDREIQLGRLALLLKLASTRQDAVHVKTLAKVGTSRVEATAMSSYENTPLLGAAEGRKPLRKDNRPYVRWPANICYLIWLYATSSNVNVLLVFVPLGSIAGARSWFPTTAFMLNFLAIIPLSVLLTFVINELSTKLRQPWRGLFSIMFTNSVKIIVSLYHLVLLNEERPTDIFR
jgi:hypothetical protein